MKNNITALLVVLCMIIHVDSITTSDFQNFDQYENIFGEEWGEFSEIGELQVTPLIQKNSSFDEDCLLSPDWNIKSMELDGDLEAITADPAPEITAEDMQSVVDLLQEQHKEKQELRRSLRLKKTDVTQELQGIVQFQKNKEIQDRWFVNQLATAVLNVEYESSIKTDSKINFEDMIHMFNATSAKNRLHKNHQAAIFRYKQIISVKILEREMLYKFSLEDQITIKKHAAQRENKKRLDRKWADNRKMKLGK